ncbi:MAG: flavodoxin [Candidatus Lernaella stagnicola]|nr:flavodoxin [Candidatus Lernaella stagnicola]
MTRVGVFFGTITGNSKQIAEAIAREFGNDVATGDISAIEPIQLNDYDLLILGTSTWHIGEIDEWDDFIGRLGAIQTANTKFALFGLGDQDDYPDRFQGALGLLYDRLRARGAEIIGMTSTEGYSFTDSAALVDGKFVGLALDDDSQQDLTATRIHNWVEQLKAKI